MDGIPPGHGLTFDFSKTRVIDHSVCENLHQFEEDYLQKGGTVKRRGEAGLQPVSSHPHAARKRSRAQLPRDQGEGPV